MKNKTEVTAAHFHKLFVNSIILPPPEKVFSGVQINNPNLKIYRSMVAMKSLKVDEATPPCHFRGLECLINTE